MYLIRPNHQRGKITIKVFYAVIICGIISLVSLAVQWYLFTKVYGEGDDSYSDTFYLVFGIDRLFKLIDTGVRIITMVVFIKWLRRAYYNLHIAYPSATSFDEGWAAGAWFVPILNWIRPFQITREVWTGTQAAMPHRYPDPSPPAPVSTWWALYLLVSFGGIAMIFIPVNESVDDWIIGSILLEIITLVAAWATIYMIKKTMAFEDDLWHEAQNPSDDVFAITTADA